MPTPEIQKVLTVASRRLWWKDVLRHWVVALTGAMGTLIVLVAVDRIAGVSTLGRVESWIDGMWSPVRSALGISPFVRTSANEDAMRLGLAFFGGVPLALITLGVACLTAYMVRRRMETVALHVDETAHLKEVLTSALYISKETHPWSKFVIDDASARARGVDVAAAVPIEAPRLWPVPVGTAVAFAVMFAAMPHFDLSGERTKKVAQEERQKELLQVKAEVNADQKKLEELVKKANVALDLNEHKDEAGDPSKPEEQDPEAFRRAAVKKLTNLAEKLQEMREEDKAPQMQAIREKMKELRQPGQGPLNEFSRQLARGDFNKAQAALEQIQKQLADAAMPEDQKAELQKQLENLSKQLEQASDAQQQVAKQLEKQGLDQQTAKELANKAAKGGDELKQALDQMKSLSEQQKKELLEMAKSQMKAAQQCQSMSQAMSKAAKGMSQEGMQQDAQESVESLAQELSEMEMMQSDMENLDAALDEAKEQLAKLGECLGGKQGGSAKDGECEGGPKIGTWKPGESRKQANGSGGPGRGNGPSPDAEAADYSTKKEKAEVKNMGGPNIGSRLVYGEQVKGTSTAQFGETVAAAEKEAAEAINNNDIPREYHDAVKTYFGRLQEKVKRDAPAPAATDKK
jgi:hypothetical protein